MSEHAHKKLNQFFATAICGNDILSSTLYVSGIAILFAGVYAPLVLAIIGLVLYFYKSVYTEVVEALPVNGGAYNCLLNGTSKAVAATAGVMTLLSYVATAVLSGNVGVEYLASIVHLPVIPTTIVLLFVFALLVISGLKDSAKVALGIFAFHVFTLVTFLVLGIIYYMHGGESYFAANLARTGELIASRGGIFFAVYLAFSASLLGVSGFESSANFVEEQEPGVFRKTLRNMLTGVAFFNPLIALVVLNSMPYETIVAAKDFLLADGAFAIGGQVFKIIVALDAFAVLWGAVLTSFVGVSGLLHRMALDGCLPAYFAKMNKKGSFPRIVIGFFLLSSSILIMTGGNLLSLAGVYTISFLGVMSLFAIGNLILKETRPELKRTYNAPIVFVILAFTATFFGIIGNILIDPKNLLFFAIYFVPTILLVQGMIFQDSVIRFLLRATKKFPVLQNYLRHHFEDMTEGHFVVFIHHVNRLYRILEYINKNETGWNITLVHCKSNEKESEKMFEQIKEVIPCLKKAGAFPHFNIKMVYKKEEFGPHMIEEVSKEMKVHKNRILIGSIHHHHPFEYSDLGGVRIIL